MEIIEVNGYTQEEKLEIAIRHLLPKQFTENGIKPKQLKLGTGSFEAIIDQYTDESGVRTLEKRIAKLVRYRAKQIALKQKHSITITTR
jgi:ATP-dependent Lon protease